MDGKKYHDKAVRTKYKGELKPFAKALKDKVDSGEAIIKEQNWKNIYLFRFNEKKIRPSRLSADSQLDTGVMEYKFEKVKKG